MLFEKDKTLQGIIDNFGRWLHTYPAGRIDDVYEVPYDEGSGVGLQEYANMLSITPMFRLWYCL